MFTRECPNCGRELTYKQKSQVTEANKKNRKCASCAARKVGLNTKCVYCSLPFYRRPSDMRSLNFCSHKCSAAYYAGQFRGENSPSWKGGPERSKRVESWRQREKRIGLKKRGIEFLGGKCKLCGYDKCIASLDFHHIDPSQKDNDFLKKCEKTWEIMKDKIKDCILLCANCHRELHWTERQKQYEKEKQLAI